MEETPKLDNIDSMREVFESTEYREMESARLIANEKSRLMLELINPDNYRTEGGIAAIEKAKEEYRKARDAEQVSEEIFLSHFNPQKV